MAEQVIDPAKPILSIKDRETIIQGNAQTYAEPRGESLEIIRSNIRGRTGPHPAVPDEDPQDTNLLPFRPLTTANLDDFLDWCGPVQGINDQTEYSAGIGSSILRVTDAYLRQICLFVNSHSPVRNRRDDYPTMAYLPHDFWAPPTFPPSAEYLEDRAKFIRTTAGLPPPRLRALTHLFIHIASFPSTPDIKPDSALMVITPRAATIEYLDQLDSPGKHHIIGDILSVISRVDTDCSSTWLELGDWKARVGSSGGAEVADRPPEKLRASQIYVCTNALAQAFGHDVNMYCGFRPMETTGFENSFDFLMRRKAMVIAIDLYRGYFSNVIGDPQYKPRVKRIFGHHIHKEGPQKPWIDNARQARNGSPWLHFAERVYRRLLHREMAQWNAENKWRGLDEEQLYNKARMRMRNPTRAGRYEGAPEGKDLGGFGNAMKMTRIRNLRRWMEDKDCERGRVDRYHPRSESVGWDVGGNILYLT
ncbi:hypothetical protein SBOR_5192 [Sclerotinia borealis F-4128]|uniref:Uncharacterized protein n=1 Tax=Sclerotinia borealis (strain F-4128) TaxID=1432307 RepID=W9CIA0_SCLBF|nr:hypothetical protein SBOR_5192 [Sclerotinia borealis F-4128]